MTHPTQLITTEAAATQLKVSVEYIHQLVKKGRLTWVGENLLNADQVATLAQLMSKLRQDGIAALVEIAGRETPRK